MPLAELDLAALRRWVITARADLDAYAEELNALNVFPVPDGDTGSNLLMTMADAVAAIDEEAPDDIRTAATAMARATLVAAHGNSGVILSQLARGVAEVVVEGHGPLGAEQVVAILSRAAELAQDGVSVPVPGTILTVAAAAADAAAAAGDTGAGLTGVTDAAVRGAADALLRTRTENDVLRRAGVVDAGGAGYLLVLEALQRVIHGEGGLAATDGTVPEWLRLSRSGQGRTAVGACDAEGLSCGPSYEVMFLLDDTTPERVAALKSRLDRLGDSLVVAGGPEDYSVHVHVDDVSAALNAGADAGRPHRFRITRFADQASVQPHAARPDTVLLALVSGDGVAEQVRATGTDIVPVRVWRDADALRGRLGARSLLLCDSPEARRAAQACSEDHEVVVVGDNAVDVVAAAVVVDPTVDFDRLCRIAQEAVDDIHSERIVGDPGQDALMRQVMDLLEGSPGCELLTFVAGDALSDERLDAVVAAVRVDRPALDIAQITRGGEGALLTVGVE